MSLLKVPFIILTAYGYHSCMIPPNKAPPKQKQYVPKAGSGMLFEVLLGAVIALLPIYAVITWGIALFECVAIFSAAYPTTSFAQETTPYLSYNNAPLSSLTITQPTVPFFASCLLTYAGYSIRCLCFRYLGKMFTFELTQRSDHQLITGGPYSIVRHPSYTGGIIGFMGHLGCALGTHSWLRQSGILYTFGGFAVAGFWVLGMVATPVLMILRLRGEEEMLRQAFGVEWEKWADRVRYRIIPGIY